MLIFGNAGLEFGFNVTELYVDIEILSDEDRNEMREAFTVHLTMDEMMVAEIQVNKESTTNTAAVYSFQK